ncbi:MAG: tripartite tricarboxylate transporter substrate binding protein [Betaproteobacteria bacterium]
MNLSTATIGTGIALAFFAVNSAGAADTGPYPSKPVRLIAPFPAGGTSDTIARTLGQKLTEAWGQGVVVDNRGGVGGIVGTTMARHAPADGYTLLVGNVTPVAINGSLYKSLDYDSVRDFVPVTMAAAGPNIIVVNPTVNAKTIKELITLLKSGGKVDFGTSGAGSISHLAGEMFKNMTGTNMLHVPYKGSALIVNDLLGGQIQISFSDMPVALPHVKAGKLRALAVTSAKPTPLVPGVPSVAEAGVPGYAIDSWWGVLVPTGTPNAVVTKLNTDIVRVLNLQDVKDRFAGLGVESVPSTQAQFAQSIKSEIAKYAKLIKDVGIRID